MRYRLLQVFLAVLVSSLTPLAQASPPDPTWLRGLYDDGDYDDIVVMVLSDVAAVEASMRHGDGPRLRIVAPAPPNDESPRLRLRPSASSPRAPPIA